ncbi:MAG: hypothetical protein IKF01_01840 [Bacilli bacterium]|nr:hypothetical protein [Bacilli bacterium]
MKKIIKKIIDKIYIIKCKTAERKMLKCSKGRLTIDERKRINKYNKKICMIIKPLYKKWDKCKIEYFVSDYYYQSKILPRLNSINYNSFGMRHKKSYFMDKNFQEVIAKSFMFPKAIIRRINGDYYDEKYNVISVAEALSKLEKYEEVVFKKSLGESHGRGVHLATKIEYKNLIDNFDRNFIVQDKIEQHVMLSSFNSSSVNVIRITSLHLGDEIYILGSTLRVGAPGSFCDHVGFDNENPRIIAIDDTGRLYGNVISPDDCKIHNDIFGKKAEGIIPKYNEIIEKIKSNHLKFLHHKIIGWDITIDKDENIICIEYNTLVPGIVQTQIVCGPVFSKMSSNDTTLLEEILKSK